MPAVSRNQRIAMAIAEHAPGKLYKRNRGLTKMSHAQLHEFASTKESAMTKTEAIKNAVVKHFKGMPDMKSLAKKRPTALAIAAKISNGRNK